MNFEVGDILMVRGDTFIVSPVIKEILHSEFSHVAIAVGKNHICEIDAFKRMRIVSNPYTDYDLYRMNTGLTAAEKLKMQTFLQEKCKTIKGYDWLRIIEIVLRRFLKWEVSLNAKNRYICSEVIDAAYAAIGINLVPQLEDEDVTPVDILKSPYIVQIKNTLAKSV